MEALLTSLGIGLLATTSPCVFPLYPGFLAYLSGALPAAQGRGARHALGVFVLAGILTMMLGFGAILAGLSVSVGSALSVLVPIADALLIVLGALLLANHNPFKALPQVRVPALSHPYANAFLYGMLYAPLALPCAGPLVVGVFAFSLTATEFASKLIIFLGFGIGFGLPLLVLSLLSGVAQRAITRAFARHSRALNTIGGVLLIGIGLFDLWINWDLLAARFA